MRTNCHIALILFRGVSRSKENYVILKSLCAQNEFSGIPSNKKKRPSNALLWEYLTELLKQKQIFKKNPNLVYWKAIRFHEIPWTI